MSDHKVGDVFLVRTQWDDRLVRVREFVRLAGVTLTVTEVIRRHSVSIDCGVPSGAEPATQAEWDEAVTKAIAREVKDAKRRARAEDAKRYGIKVRAGETEHIIARSTASQFVTSQNKRFRRRDGWAIREENYHRGEPIFAEDLAVLHAVFGDRGAVDIVAERKAGEEAAGLVREAFELEGES
jgi:hypothetical protein